MSSSILILPKKVNLFLFPGNIANNCSLFQIVNVMVEINILSNLVLFCHLYFIHFKHDVLLDSFIREIFNCFSRVSTKYLPINSLFSFLIFARSTSFKITLIHKRMLAILLFFLSCRFSIFISISSTGSIRSIYYFLYFFFV